MTHPRHLLRILLLALPLHCAAEEPLLLVLQNGRSIPVSALALEKDKFVVKAEVEGFKAGQAIPMAMADHIYGEKPAAINQAAALALTGKPVEARDLLLPVVKDHAITARIPGNFWLDAARTLLVAHALDGDTPDTNKIGKEISDATPAQGIDSFVLLGKALLLPAITTPVEEREQALRDLTTDNHPANVRAYASYFRGNILKKENKKTEALEAFLSIPCLYPSGGLILNAAAELQAADLLAEAKRREEALALAGSALISSAGTLLADEANTRITSLK
jgi:tetratricopeptide (TPR) repeat protein